MEELKTAVQDLLCNLLIFVLMFVLMFSITGWWTVTGDKMVTGRVVAKRFDSRPYPHTVVYLVYDRVNGTLTEHSYDVFVSFEGKVEWDSIIIGKRYTFVFGDSFMKMYPKLEKLLEES